MNKILLCLLPCLLLGGCHRADNPQNTTYKASYVAGHIEIRIVPMMIGTLVVPQPRQVMVVDYKWESPAYATEEQAKTQGMRLCEIKRSKTKHYVNLGPCEVIKLSK